MSEWQRQHTPPLLVCRDTTRTLCLGHARGEPDSLEPECDFIVQSTAEAFNICAERSASGTDTYWRRGDLLDILHVSSRSARCVLPRRWLMSSCLPACASSRRRIKALNTAQTPFEVIVRVKSKLEMHVL